MNLPETKKFNEAAFSADNPDLFAKYLEDVPGIEVPDEITVEIPKGKGSETRTYRLTLPDKDWTAKQHEKAQGIMALYTSGVYGAGTVDQSVDAARTFKAMEEGSAICKLYALFYLETDTRWFEDLTYQKRVADMAYLVNPPGLRGLLQLFMTFMRTSGDVTHI